MKKSYPAIFTKEDGGFSVIFPEFSGATEGDDLEEAMANAKDFLDNILAYYIDENITIPKTSDITELEMEDSKGGFVSLIQGDPSPYIKTKTVRKNVTIPEGLASKGERDKVNFSKILTEALYEMYDNNKLTTNK